MHYLGCDLPPAAFAQLAREEEASIAALSCAQGTSRPALLEAIAELAAQGIPVLVGGAGIDADGAAHCGAAAYGGTLHEAQAEARRLAAGAALDAGRP